MRNYFLCEEFDMLRDLAQRNTRRREHHREHFDRYLRDALPEQRDCFIWRQDVDEPPRPQFTGIVYMRPRACVRALEPSRVGVKSIHQIRRKARERLVRIF